MVKSERQRQKKLAKRQKRASDVRKLARINRNPSTRDLILQTLGNRWEVCCKRGSDGMTSIIALRSVRVGNPIGVVFLVDSYCLGVKDAFISRAMDLDRIRETVRNGEDDVIAVSPEYALKFVSSAIDYARSIGLEPSVNAELCLLMFSDVDASLCQDEFIFGKDGKPFYINGPNDTPESMALVMKKLEKLGDGNFNFAVVGGLGSSGDFRRIDDHGLFEEGFGPEAMDDEDGEFIDDEVDQAEEDNEVMNSPDFKRVE